MTVLAYALERFMAIYFLQFLDGGLIRINQVIR